MRLTVIFIFAAIFVQSVLAADPNPKSSDPFIRLGLNPAGRLTADSLKSAYRQAATRFHPDRNPGPDSQANFIAIKEAYETLRGRVNEPTPDADEIIIVNTLTGERDFMLEMMARNAVEDARRREQVRRQQVDLKAQQDAVLARRIRGGKFAGTAWGFSLLTSLAIDGGYSLLTGAPFDPILNGVVLLGTSFLPPMFYGNKNWKDWDFEKVNPDPVKAGRRVGLIGGTAIGVCSIVIGMLARAHAGVP